MPLLWLSRVLCFGCFCCALPKLQERSLSSSSFFGNLPLVDSNMDTPWLASMPGNCQGIVLTPWLILSTASCLKKSKLSPLDISGVNDPESIPHGQKVCLHPKFDLQDENDPVKADIGFIILEAPIIGDEIPLSQSTNVTLKSCSKCHYRSCGVYQYQSSKKLGTTRVKKIDVQLLEFSTCHHQYSYLEKTEGLCIQSQPRQDCWIQKASPVLCLLKNHWQLLGLIHKTSKICLNPTVIIRIAPYFTWMKRFIKASKKLLNPTSSLHCKTLYGNEHVPQIRHDHNNVPTLASSNSSLRALQGNIGISPPSKHIQNFPMNFNFSNGNSLTESHTLFLDKTQTPQTVRILAEQVKASPIARLPENSEKNLIRYHQYTPPPNIGNLGTSPLSQLISNTAISYTSPTADRDKPWDNTDDKTESFEEIMANIIKQWSPSVDDGLEPKNSHKSHVSHDNTLEDSWTENSTNLEAFRDILKALSNGSENQHTTKANLPPNLPLSEKEEPQGLINLDGAINKTNLSMESLPVNKAFDMSLFESDKNQNPSATIELWTSSHNFNVLSSQKQPVADSVGNHDPPAIDVQVLPMANIDMPSTPKLVTYAPLSKDLEAKNPSFKNQYSAMPLQASFRPTVEIQP